MTPAMATEAVAASRAAPRAAMGRAGVSGWSASKPLAVAIRVSIEVMRGSKSSPHLTAAAVNVRFPATWLCTGRPHGLKTGT